MNLSFRTKLTSIIFALILTAVSGSTFFFIQLYKKDKMAAILQTELSNSSKVVDHLDNLINLVDLVDIEKAISSKNIILIYDDPCDKSKSTHGIISRNYEKSFSAMDISPSLWLDSLSLFKACSVLKASEFKGLTVDALIVPSKVQIMEPYLPVLVRGVKGIRFALLSMDGFQTSAASTLFIADANGNILWSADGDGFTQLAMADTGVATSEIKRFVVDAQHIPGPKVVHAGAEALVSYAKAVGDWTIISLAFEPALMQPVDFALRQSIYLALGFIFICLFIGKNSASLITKPLSDLKAHAERLGQGDFIHRIQVNGTDEISVVKTAFNLMTEKILELIEDTKLKVNFERDLELAQEVQLMLLPKTSVSTTHFNLHSFVQAADTCGGDWWGYLEIPRPNADPLLLIIIGDVTGHGTSSALITAVVRGGLSILSSWIEENSELAGDPRQINQLLNRAVHDAAKSVIQMTLFSAIIDPSNQLLYCSNAGHNLPYLYTPSSDGSPPQISMISRAGPPLGQSEDSTYLELDTYPWVQGSQLLLYTDGLIDCYQGDVQLCSRKTLRKSLELNRAFRGRELLTKILKEREHKIGSLPTEDDVMVVLCELKNGSLGKV